MKDTIDLFDELSKLNNELVNTQRELCKKNAKLQELGDQKNFFIGMLAHDLRNPLGNVMNASILLSNMLQDKLTDCPEAAEFLDLIRESSKNMLALVNNTLDIAKMDSPKLNITLMREDIVEIIQWCLSSNNYICAKKDITLDFVNQANAPLYVAVDRMRMEQLFNNLITNAVKFSYPGSSILVKLEVMKDEFIISVTDHGNGIPESELGNIFEPFQLTSVNSTSGEKRTGLGLTIVEKIAHAHNGKVSVESEVNKGTTFYVSFPLNN